MRFSEEQRFRIWWLLAVIAGIAAIGWYGFIEQVVRGNEIGSNSLPDWGVVIVWLLLGIGMPAFFWWFKLETTVEADALQIRMAPLANRRIVRNEIARFGVRTYKPIREYGGWGVRGLGSNRAYNMSGKQGVQIELVNGDRVLIGSQRPDELSSAIEQLTERSPSIWKSGASV